MHSIQENETDALGSWTDPTADSTNPYSRFGVDADRQTRSTPLGEIKTWARMTLLERSFLVFSLVNICTAMGLTIARMVNVLKEDPDSPKFALTLLLLVNAGFCFFYVVHGLLRERKYEMYAFMGAVLLVIMYCILEYAVFNPSHHTTIKKVRLGLACGLGVPNIFIAFCVSRKWGYLEFRQGALPSQQRLYRQAAIFSCFLKFDLQAACSLTVLALKEGIKVDVSEAIPLGICLAFSIAWYILGWKMLKEEYRPGAWVFFVLGLVKPGYYLFKIVKVSKKLAHRSDSITTVTYCLLASSIVALVVWFVLMVALGVVYRNFGKGLAEPKGVMESTETTDLLGRQQQMAPPTGYGNEA